MPLYSVRTTIGQEKSASKSLRDESEKEGAEIYSVTAIDRLRGYLIVEAESDGEIERVIRGIKHIRGVIEQEMDIDQINHFLEQKPLTSEIKRGDIVELTSGAFKREKAKVKRIDKANEKITVEILEAEVPIPLTVDASDVRVIPSQKEKYK